MRHVKRLARQTRAGVRRPPPPRWAVWLRRGTLTVIGLGLIGFAAETLWRSPAVAQLLREGEARLIAATGGAGFVVERIYSEGRALTEEKSLVKALEPAYGSPILAVDLDELKERVERVAWVRSASISRQLPNTLWVRLEEYRPIARWMDGSRQVLVSEAGEVVRVANPERFRELPLLFGKGAPQRAAELLRLVAAEPGLARRVTGARLVGERRWDVHLDGRVEARLPARGAEAAWHRLAAEQESSNLLERAITAVDLRNPGWLTVQVADEALRHKGDAGA